MADIIHPRSEIKALTGLRGIAALWVAVYHFFSHQADGIAASGVTTPTFIAHGYLAVDVFFALSGFVMVLSYGHLFEAAKASNYGVFFLRRIARIYPLYVFILALVIASNIFRHAQPFAFAETAYNLMLIQSWGLCQSFIGQSWSVSTEMAAYVVFPAILLATRRSNPVAIGAILLTCFSALIFICYFSISVTDTRAGPLDVHDHHSALPLVRCVSEFALGVLVYRIAEYRRFARLADSDVISVLTFFAAVGLAGTDGQDLKFSICALALIFVLSGRNVLSRIFGSRLPCFLGVISYAIYLIHDILIHPVWNIIARLHLRGDQATLASLTVYLVLSATIALGLNVTIERSGRKALRALEAVFNRQAHSEVTRSEILGASRIRGR